MSGKDKGVSISLGLVFSLIAGVGSYFTGKADAQTERAVMTIKIDYLTDKVKALEATKPEIVAERVKVLGETVNEMKTDQKIIITLLDEISNHNGS